MTYHHDNGSHKQRKFFLLFIFWKKHFLKKNHFFRGPNAYSTPGVT